MEKNKEQHHTKNQIKHGEYSDTIIIIIIHHHHPSSPVSSASHAFSPFLSNQPWDPNLIQIKHLTCAYIYIYIYSPPHNLQIALVRTRCLTCTYIRRVTIWNTTCPALLFKSSGIELELLSSHVPL